MRPNKTFIPKVADLKRSWYVIDAEGIVLGRLAAIVANKLRGKDKVYFTPNMQCGDNIIIVNSEKVLLKGQKRSFLVLCQKLLQEKFKSMNFASA